MKKVLGLISVLAVGIAPLVAQSQSQPQPQPQSQSAAPAPVDQPAQGPTFRTGVDVVAVDVSVVDGNGKPVEDLLAPDFVVKIDGQPRRVVSADHVRIDVEAAKREAANPFETLFTTNLKPPNGRMFVIAVDQLGIRFGGARGLLETAGKFLDQLSPADRTAFVAYPEPGISGRVSPTIVCDSSRRCSASSAGSRPTRAGSTSACTKRLRSPRRATAGSSRR